MKWLGILLIVALLPVSTAWAVDAGESVRSPRPGPGPSPAITVERENSFAWWVMDKVNPTIRLAGPYHFERECATRAAAMNSICRPVRD